MRAKNGPEDPQRKMKQKSALWKLQIHRPSVRQRHVSSFVSVLTAQKEITSQTD